MIVSLTNMNFINHKKTIMKKNILFLSLLFIVVFFASCKKSNDTTKPSISIDNPLANDTVSMTGKNSIPILISLTDNTMLDKTRVEVYDKANVLVYNSTPFVPSLRTFSFYEQFKPTNISGATMFTLKVSVTDVSQNTEMQTVPFYVKP